MQLTTALFLAAAGSAMLAGGASAATRDAVLIETLPLEISSQATQMERPRTRPRIRVTPLYPRRNEITLYPLPYGIDYPGPRAVRQCVSRLVPEYRASGTVIVPRMRCWWAPR